MSESFQEFVARVNSNGFLVNDQTKVPRTVRSKKHKIVRQAEQLDEGQLSQLLALIDGIAALVSVKGEMYTIQKEGDGYRVQCTKPRSPSHFVTRDLCSCEDCRFRQRVCKHILAVRRFLL